jgi:hypothetical protein
MSTERYRDAIKTLGLPTHGTRTRTALGLKARQLARLAAGTTVPSLTLQRLLEALIALKTA